MKSNDVPDHLKAAQFLDQAGDELFKPGGTGSAEFMLRCANTHALVSIATSLYQIAEKHGDDV